MFAFRKYLLKLQGFVEIIVQMMGQMGTMYSVGKIALNKDHTNKYVVCMLVNFNTYLLMAPIHRYC